jgi:DNA-binding MurR/RpiR family transcriptional regulator
MSAATLDERISSRFARLSPTEQRVARFFQENRAEVLHASAAALSTKTKTSDATVIRTARSLGFKGLDDLRATVAAEFSQGPSISNRLSETLREVGGDLNAALQSTLDIHARSIENLRRDISPQQFRKTVQLIGKARRVAIFGIGPSSAMATYWAFQLGRFGIDALALTQTGLLFADDLRKLRTGDVLIIMAYGRVYRELSVLLAEAGRLNLKNVLLTDGLGVRLQAGVDLVLTVARGRADMLSMHTATLSLIEALLVGTAAGNPKGTLRSVERLNELRTSLVGKPMDLVTKRGEGEKPKRR